MADIDIKNQKGGLAATKPSKKPIRVDLTPMVDLGFLLITFFVFTTTMSRPTAMDIKTPVDGPAADPVCNSCAVTVLLDKKDAVYYYTGAFEAANVKRSDFISIRNVMQQQKKTMQESGRDISQFSLIIKASDSASFRNFVDITDEVAINDIKRYYIDELTDAERAEMKMK